MTTQPPYIPKTGLLATEIAFYEENVMWFEIQYPNRYVLIYGDALIGDFATIDEALIAGLEKFGQVPLLIRKPGEKTPVLKIPTVQIRLPHYFDWKKRFIAGAAVR